MPDSLYERDILSWSQNQADLLRRLARGEGVNDVDWEHVVEEIEDVGLSELNAVRSYLRLMLVHLLKIYCWPDNPSIDHWRGEVVSFQTDAEQRFSPSMRQRIDLAVLYGKAVAQIGAARFDGISPRVWPAECPFSLDNLLTEDRGKLEAGFERATDPNHAIAATTPDATD
jgi:hypothetical protein